jgi:zinc-ribbon domain
MALTCARCGTQNPDGNRFCMSCGTPLVPAAQQAPVATAVAPPPPSGAGYAPPPPQPGYQSPYYAPQPGMPVPAVHRTPWVLIISIVVAAVLVLSGVGTVLALTAGHKDSQSSSFQSISSPSPLASPSAGQTAQPSQPSSGGSSVSNDSETVAVPAGWQVVNKDANSISLQSPNADGALTIASGAESPPATAQQLKDQIDKQLAAKYADAGPCQGSGTDTGAIAGVNGIFWTECFTLTSGGQSVAVGEPLWVGANANGSVAYVVVLQTTQDNLETFIKESVPVLKDGITWKLK